MKIERNYSIDALRFIFILLICTMHYNWRFFPQAYLAVEGCFIISGLLLALNYEAYQKESVFIIIKRKLLRLYPIYVCMILLYCILFREYQIAKIIDNLFFLCVFSRDGGSTFMCVPYWYIMVYVWLSLLIILIMKNMDKKRGVYLIFFIVMVLYMALRNKYDYTNITYEHSLGFIPISFVRGLIGMGLGYILGMWYLDDGQRQIEKVSGKFFDVIVWGCILLIFYIFRHDVTAKYDFIIEIPVIMLLCSFLRKQKKCFLIALLDFIGRLKICSLGLAVYLVHPVIVKCFQKYEINSNKVNLLFYFGIVMLIAVCLVLLENKIIDIFGSAREDAHPNEYVISKNIENQRKKTEEYIKEAIIEEKTVSNTVIIDVDNVTIRFNLATQKVDNLKEYFVKLIKHELMFQEFFAVKNVSFQIKKGEAWGIIGVNGSGKSTILKAISGILKPYQGTVSVCGTIAPLLELGAGFDGNLTARENIILNGCVLGYTEEFMKIHFNEIVDFAELWDFLDSPVKNFSSGMSARLGFAIATVVCPDILIVDEVLSVGDIRFREKCERKIKEMLESKTTLLYVSHSISEVKRLCSKAVWLDKGIMLMSGDADEVCNAYLDKMKA